MLNGIRLLGACVYLLDCSLFRKEGKEVISIATGLDWNKSTNILRLFSFKRSQRRDWFKEEALNCRGFFSSKRKSVSRLA